MKNEKIKQFCIECDKTTADEYEKRKQPDVRKRIKDNYFGKIAEEYVYKYVNKKLGLITTKPDYEIYQKWEKSYEADLKTNKINIHVKSITKESARRYSTSWIFQKTDPLVNSMDKNDIIAAVLVDEKTEECNLLGFISASKVTYGEPKIPKHKAQKTVLYFERNRDNFYKVGGDI